MRYSLIALVLNWSLADLQWEFFQLAFITSHRLHSWLAKFAPGSWNGLSHLQRYIDVGNAPRCRSIHRGRMEIEDANGHENSAMGFYLSCGITVSQSTAAGQELLRRPIQLSLPLAEKFIPHLYTQHALTRVHAQYCFIFVFPRYIGFFAVVTRFVPRS